MVTAYLLNLREVLAFFKLESGGAQTASSATIMTIRSIIKVKNDCVDQITLSHLDACDVLFNSDLLSLLLLLRDYNFLLHFLFLNRLGIVYSSCSQFSSLPTPFKRSSLSNHLLLLISDRVQRLDIFIQIASHLSHFSLSSGVKEITSLRVLAKIHVELHQLHLKPHIRHLSPTGLILVRVNDIPLSDIYHLFSGRSETISELLTPAFFVHFRGIVSILAGVHVHPPVFFCYKDFSPNMVSQVMDLSRVMAERADKASEAVGPLTTAALPTLDQLTDIVVSGEADFLVAALAEIKFTNASTALFSLLLVRWTASSRFDLVPFSTERAVWFICPLEKLMFVPVE